MLAALLLFNVLTTATTSDVRLSPEIQNVIDKHLTQKIAELETKSYIAVQRLTDRVAEVEAMRARDVQMFVSRIQEVEDRRAKDARDFKKRFQTLSNLHAKDVQVLSQRLQEVADFGAKNIQALTDRITETAKESMPLSSRLLKVHDFTRRDIETNTTFITKDTGETQSIASSDRRTELKTGHATVKRIETLESHDIGAKGDHISETNDLLYVSKKRELGIGVSNSRPDLGPRERLQRVAMEHLDGVAFHAVLAKHVVNPTQDLIIKFRTIKTNIGGGYHPATGVFTCVKPGIYVFSWSLRINYGPRHGMTSQIVHNGAVFGRSAVGSGGADDHFSQSSATAAVHLAQGDEVWIRVESLYPGTNISEIYSMFTGFLVHG